MKYHNSFNKHYVKNPNADTFYAVKHSQIVDMENEKCRKCGK